MNKRFTIPTIIIAAGLLLTGCSSTDAPAKEVPASTHVAETVAPKPVETKKPVATETVNQKQATEKAKSYLDFKSFSQAGLVKQLKYDEFSDADAKYAAAHVGANWNDQAVRAAKEYISITSFSRGGLIKQLKFDGYTAEQAEHGADAVGLK